MTRGLRGTTLVTLAAFALAAAACGDDEEANEATSETVAAEPTNEGAEAEGESAEEQPEQPAEEAEPTFEEQVAQSEPLNIEIQPQTFGDQQIQAVRCTMQGREMLDDSGMDMLGAVEVMGNQLYTLTHEGKLLRFTIGEGEGQGCTVTLDTSFGEQGVMSFEHDIDSLDVAGDTLLAANSIFSSWRITNGGPPQECGEGGNLTIAPDGSYALKAFANADTEKINFTDAGCTSEPYAPFADGRPFSNVNTIGFLEQGPIFGGIVEVNGEDERIAIAYDREGNERFRFGGTESGAEDGFGWFHAIEQCGDQICVLDSNYRRLSIWTNEGEFRGTVDLSDLFGLRYPWIPDFEYTGDGTAYFAASQERGDSDVYEGNIFRVTNLP